MHTNGTKLLDAGQAASPQKLRRIMKRSATTHPIFDPGPVRQWLSIANSIILLGGPTTTGKRDWINQMRQEYPKAIYVRATGPDVAFPFEEDQPLIIENFHKLSGRTRKFILGLPIPLVLSSTRPLYWEFWRQKRKVIRIIP